MSSNNSNQTLIAIGSAIIIALLGAVIYLFTTKNSVNEELEANNLKLEQTIQLKDSLDTAFDEAMLELDDMKGTNVELNEIIEQQKADLTKQKNRIAGLISSKRKLNEARDEIANLNARVEQYIAQINQLQGEKETLISEKQTLTTDLTTARASNEELMTAKATLVSEKAELEDVRSQLAEKVEIGSVVKTSKIAVQPYKIRKNGKLDKKKSAKRTDMLEICFDMNRNGVVAAGDESFQFVLMDPTGTPMLNDTQSGSFESKETGSEIRYTFEVTEAYTNAAKNVCVQYQHPEDYQKGIHEIMVYNKGFFAGTGSFTLK